MNRRMKTVESLIRNKRLAIDFDGVIQDTNDRIKNFICFAEPINGAKESLDYLKKQGYKIIIYTARPWFMKLHIKFWMDYYDIPYDKIVCGKPICQYYIDDHAIEFKNWKQTLRRIK